MLKSSQLYLFCPSFLLIFPVIIAYNLMYCLIPLIDLLFNVSSLDTFCLMLIIWPPCFLFVCIFWYVFSHPCVFKFSLSHFFPYISLIKSIEIWLTYLFGPVWISLEWLGWVQTLSSHLQEHLIFFLGPQFPLVLRVSKWLSSG